MGTTILVIGLSLLGAWIAIELLKLFKQYLENIIVAAGSVAIAILILKAIFSLV